MANETAAAVLACLQECARALSLSEPDAPMVATYTRVLAGIAPRDLLRATGTVLRSWSFPRLPPPAEFIGAVAAGSGRLALAAGAWERVKAASVCALTHPREKIGIPIADASQAKGEARERNGRLFDVREVPCSCADAERWDRALIEERLGPAYAAAFDAAGGSAVLRDALDTDPWPANRFRDAFLEIADTRPDQLVPAADRMLPAGTPSRTEAAGLLGTIASRAVPVAARSPQLGRTGGLASVGEIIAAKAATGGEPWSTSATAAKPSAATATAIPATGASAATRTSGGWETTTTEHVGDLADMVAQAPSKATVAMCVARPDDVRAILEAFTSATGNQPNADDRDQARVWLMAGHDALAVARLIREDFPPAARLRGYAEGVAELEVRA